MLPTLKQNGEPEVAKRRKHNLSGLDFQGLLDLRSQVDEALTGYRSTLEKQLAALGNSVASIGGSGSKGDEGRPKI
jgi:hypothetical protein